MHPEELWADHRPTGAAITIISVIIIRLTYLLTYYR